MFDLIFDAFSAWNQIGLILMGVVFMSIGGGLIGYELYWHAKAVKIKGRISAVRVSGGGGNVSLRERQRKQAAQETQSNDDPLDIVEEFKKDPASTSFGGLFLLMFIGIPLAFSCFGAYMGYKYINLTNTGDYAQATVIRNDSSYDSESGTSYKAVLEFQDAHGQRWEVKDNISYGSSPSYSSGTRVGVYYEADNPQKFVIHDFWHNMGIAIGFFCIGFVFIGFLFLSSFLNNKKKKLPVGNRKPKQSFTGEMYYSVFEYQMPNGERAEKIGGMGSNSLLSRIPGTPVRLMVFPNKPEKVRRPSVILPIFGLIFFLPGVFIINIAFTTFETNYMTFLMVLAGLGFVGYKIWSFVQKIPREDIKAGWAEFKTKGVQVSSSDNRKDKGRVLENAEILARIKVSVKHARLAGYIMMILAFGLMGGAYYSGLDMIDHVRNDIRASGEVVNINSRYSSSSDSSGYTYYSVVTFTDIDGRLARFEDGVGASHPMHKKGEIVDIMYPLDNPKNAIIDRGIFNWGLSGALALGALLLLWGALHNLGASKRFGATKHRRRV